ncbi:MAG: NAD(P)H-hydrate dehydratase [Novosphingobium sp.]
MPSTPDQILTVAQMRAAEEALIAGGTSVDELMQRAGCGAADWVWRLAANHRVSVLCGPGNNGGDGYVIAEAIRDRGGKVAVIAATEPKTDAARVARSLYRGEVLANEAEIHGELFVDCLFGSGLTRPLQDEHLALLTRLAANHRHRVAIDLPSGVEADSGAYLNADLPRFDLTISLGAWKFAHFLMPASAAMGALRLVGIGVPPAAGAAAVVRQPQLSAPASDAHKYRRGLVGVVGGAMQGAALLACAAAQRAGAGYVKLMAADAPTAPCDLVVDTGQLSDALADCRISALLVGPGLGRDEVAVAMLASVIASGHNAVLDADALVVIQRELLAGKSGRFIATPHEGELAHLESAFGCAAEGSKPERAAALAQASGMVIVAKGPDTVIAAPDGRIACAPRASSWLSAAGTGDVLAGTIASRLATGTDPFDAACEGVWLHSEAARLCPPPFTASQLAAMISAAYAAASERS